MGPTTRPDPAGKDTNFRLPRESNWVLRTPSTLSVDRKKQINKFSLRLYG